MAPSCCKHLIQILRYLLSTGYARPFAHHLSIRYDTVKIESIDCFVRDAFSV